MERQKIVVLDASVVIKWFNNEQDTDKARKLRQKYADGEMDISVPSLLFYEVSNALRYNKEFRTRDVEEALKDLYDMQLETIFNHEVLSDAVQIAHRSGLTIYDSVYVSLAKYKGCKLVTADAKIIDKTDPEYAEKL